MKTATLRPHRAKLETLYAACNRAELISPDPVQFLHRYPCREDREIVGLVAASLAYGNVKQILRNVDWVLTRLGAHPRACLTNVTRLELRRLLRGFRHRWTTEAELVAFLWGIRGAVGRYGSLLECFQAGWDERADTVWCALSRLVCRLREGSDGEPCASLLPDPDRGSACKRLHLFLRWMVRRDAVDTGDWAAISRAKLVIPLDTHMHRVARVLGVTRRNQADRRTALEITEAFRAVSPRDPVRYDFALTRLGIREEWDMDMVLRAFAATGRA